MNILIFNWRDIKNPKKGGAELILFELSKRLIQNNHTVTWFASSFPNAKKEEDFEGIHIIRKGNEFTVYLHAFLYYKKLTKKPDKVLDCVNTVCWQTPLYVPNENRILYANQSARRVFFYEYPFFLALLFYILEPLQYLTYSNTKTLCYSKSIMQDLLSFGISKNLVNIFNLGVDHKRYKKGKKSKNPTFVFTARFVKNKRPDLVIFAMKQVIKKYPMAMLYMIGYGSEEKNIKKIIIENQLRRNVVIVNKDNVFLKKNKKDKKVLLMQNAWALILPSVKEGWGMVVTEAAACGTPSIVANVSGLKDSVIHEETGLILSEKPGENELAQSMERIISDNGLREKLSEQAENFSSQFTWQKSFNEFYKVLYSNTERKEKKNILIFNWRDIKNPMHGGAEIALFELSKRLVKEKYSVIWFCSNFQGSLHEEKIEGVTIIRRGNKFTVYFHAFLYYKKLANKPDVILDCVNTVSWQTPLYIPQEKRILYVNQSARKIFFYEYPFIVALIGYILEPFQYLFYKNTKTICFSKSIKNDLISFGVPKNNIGVFPLGIDHSKYVPGKKDKKANFVFVGRLVKNKRADLCVIAMGIVTNQIPGAKLYLIGKGPEYNNIKKIIKEKNLLKNIVIYRDSSDSHKTKTMQNAWALILPSVKEGWGMVVTEAAACGTPSIVSNVTGLKDSVIDKKTGIILSQNPTSTELSKALLTISLDKELRNNMSGNAFIFSKQFTWEKSYRVFHKLLFNND